VKKEIKIEEIRNYLGTCLRIYNHDKTLVKELKPSDLETMFFIPEVHNLDKLTQEIEHNGKKFVPIVELAAIEFPDMRKAELIGNEVWLSVGYEGSQFIFYFDNFMKKFYYKRDRNDNSKNISNYTEVYNYCYSMHLDMFDWLSNDLAIEKK
jgi:hypothetical protein